ncbi:SLAM family member 9-like [Anabas testudineus]|uniref:SLAM family member 9-like n=1 Tax=Anabas testudineus TaxID=64144 RepID=UPI000E45D3AA|nr:SLAM family member 9-like [Anabas testudineus]
MINKTLLLVTASDSVLTEDDPTYLVLGGNLVLMPPAASTQPVISSIRWKYNGNLLAEMVEGKILLDVYGRFNGRTTLNTTTGCLEVNNMTKDDTGFYSVEINYSGQSVRYDVKVINKVPKPVIQVFNSTSDSYRLSCEGNTTEAEPVTYSWKTGDGEWKESEKSITISNTEETQRVETFSCRMKNPVSEEDSESSTDLFLKPRPPHFRLWIYLGFIMKFLAVIVLLWVVGYLMWRKQKAVCSCECVKSDD